MAPFNTPEIARKSTTREGAIAKAQYNALVRSVEREPLTKNGKLEVGKWYFCPATMNVFEYKGTSGGFKDGTVVFDLDLTPESTSQSVAEGAVLDVRASPGDEYHYKKTKKEDYHFVDHEAYAREFAILAPGGANFDTAFPALVEAIEGSSMTNVQLKRNSNAEYRAEVSCGRQLSRRDLVVAVLMTAAKRHVGNEDRKELEALEAVCNSDAKERVRGTSEEGLAEWSKLVWTYVEKEKDSRHAATTTAHDVIDLTSTPTGSSTRGVATRGSKAATAKPASVRKPAPRNLEDELSTAAAATSNMTTPVKTTVSSMAAPRASVKKKETRFLKTGNSQVLSTTTPVKTKTKKAVDEPAKGSPIASLAVAAALMGVAYAAVTVM